MISLFGDHERNKRLYRAFLSSSSGRLDGFKVIEAVSDNDATMQARHLVSDLAIEVWEADRLVGRFEPHKSENPTESLLPRGGSRTYVAEIEDSPLYVYRAFRMSKTGKPLRPPIIIEATSEADAIQQILALVKDDPIELWDRDRTIGRFGPRKRTDATSS